MNRKGQEIERARQETSLKIGLINSYDSPVNTAKNVRRSRARLKM